MSNLSQRIANLSPEKLALLEQRLIKKNTSWKKKEVIKHRQTSEPCPLSFSQQRLWFLNQLGANSSYHIPIALRLTGTLNLEALRQTLNAVIVRHEVLRTTYTSVNESPLQVITNNKSVDLKVIDLSDRYNSNDEAEVQQILQKEAQQLFDLSSDLMLRATLVQLSQEEYVLLLVMHHIASDGWSIGILWKELASFYKAFSTGNSILDPELPIQYADFAVWQRQWLSGEVLKKQINYWKQQLAGIPPLLELPTDKPRPSVQTYGGRAEYFQVNQDLSQKLKTLSQQSGTSLFMVLTAAFSTLMYRYTGQEDIVIGSPIANRNHSEIEPLIGFFVNTLALRSQFLGNPTFLELLSQVRETTLAAYDHQDLPFEKLVEELQPQRSLSHTPLFQVMFVLQNAPIGKIELPDLNITPVKLEDTTAQFDLTLSMEETATGLTAELVYNKDLFNPTTIARMALHFQTLLAGIVANPTTRIAQLPLLRSAEANQLLVEWNNTGVNYPQNKCIHRVIEEQVEQTPDAVAVVFENQQLTYRELNTRANQLAHYLQAKGVTTEVLVGICVERSLEMVVGLLGILKAGGAYVPLDPTYPQDRLSFMLADSQVGVLLTQKKLASTLCEYQTDLVCLDTDWTIISQQSAENPVSEVELENLAYMIYTSGSTGKPKGAMNTHSGISNRLLWMQDAYQLTTKDRVLQKTPFSFDVSVWEFFWTLMTGACLVVAKPDGHKDSAYLVELIAEQKITTLHFVPSMLQVFLEEQELDSCNCLRQVFCSGEALPIQLQERFFTCLQAELHNLYGPTEAAIDVTYWQCQPNSNLRTVPIGRPIANTQLYILDKYFQPVPIGVAGELHIGGAGLARGYLNRQELTQEKFVPNPFAKESSARLYKTGDLARYLEDGSIEYLGRLDYQVKIRGFRIELGEIEEAIAQYPQVRETVVLAREDQPGDKRLVAYVVPHQHASVTTSELRNFLKEKLPEYMIPSSFVIMDTLPLTPNGKIDRRALPAPDTSNITATSSVSPRTTTELRLMQIWEEILHIHPIGVQDNFFDLGGHSLLAVSLMNRISQHFGKKLSLATLFQSPTIENLAHIINSSVDSSSPSSLIQLQAGGEKRPFFCVHPGGGTVMTYLALARYLGSEQPFYGLESLNLDEEEEINSTVEDMAAHYIETILTVQPQGPYQIGGWSFGGLVAFEIAQQLQAQGQQVSLLALVDTYPSQDEEAEDDVTMLQDLLAMNNGPVLGILPELEPIQEQRLLQFFKNHLVAANNYTAQPYQGKVTLFLAEEGIATDSIDPIISWEKIATGGVNVQWVPGDHLEVVREPNVQILAEKLRACLD